MTDDTSSEDFMRYDLIMAEAMYGVVRRILERIANDGLQGAHYYLIHFDLRVPGVKVSETLRNRYGDDLTIVLQNQFEDLTVTETGFSVRLYFSGVGEDLTVPFSAIISLTDPHAEFGMNFNVTNFDGGDDDGDGGAPKSNKKMGELVDIAQFRPK